MNTLMTGLTVLQYRLAMLDAFLTRQEWRAVVQTAKNQSGRVEDINSRTYYLSDGGYSRIGIGLPQEDNSIPVFLDSVSREEVRLGWVMARELVEDVRQAAYDEWKAAGYVE
jgi:hypothetical protein